MLLVAWLVEMLVGFFPLRKNVERRYVPRVWPGVLLDDLDAICSLYTNQVIESDFFCQSLSSGWTSLNPFSRVTVSPSPKRSQSQNCQEKNGNLVHWTSGKLPGFLRSKHHEEDDHDILKVSGIYQAKPWWVVYRHPGWGTVRSKNSYFLRWFVVVSSHVVDNVWLGFWTCNHLNHQIKEKNLESIDYTWVKPGHGKSLFQPLTVSDFCNRLSNSQYSRVFLSTSKDFLHLCFLGYTLRNRSNSTAQGQSNKPM